MDAGCNGIILKTGEMLTRADIESVMSGKKNVFNQPIMEKILQHFKHDVKSAIMRQEALVNYEIDELVQKLFPKGNGGLGVNATRLVVRALELRIIDLDNLHPDEE